MRLRSRYPGRAAKAAFLPAMRPKIKKAAQAAANRGHIVTFDREVNGNVAKLA
jgi:sirohydrochlorin ferrochelatase